MTPWRNGMLARARVGRLGQGSRSGTSAGIALGCVWCFSLVAGGSGDRLDAHDQGGVFGGD